MKLKMMLDHSVLRLLHEYLGGIVWVDEGFVVEVAVSHIIVYSTVLSEYLHVAIVFSHLFNPKTQKTNKSIATSIIEP